MASANRSECALDDDDDDDDAPALKVRFFGFGCCFENCTALLTFALWLWLSCALSLLRRLATRGRHPNNRPHSIGSRDPKQEQSNES